MLQKISSHSAVCTADFYWINAKSRGRLQIALPGVLPFWEDEAPAEPNVLSVLSLPLFRVSLTPLGGRSSC